jgi:lipopolysaccharide export system protein LptC
VPTLEKKKTASKGASEVAPQLSEKEFQRLFGLIKGADSVELKLTIPESDQRSAVAALDMDPLNAQLRQVFFFDTPELTLYEQGVVARARRVQKKGDDSVVKLRPVVPTELSSSLRKSPNLVVEVDAMPGGFVCSASLKRALDTTPVREAAAGKRPLRKLFSKEQRAFYAAHAPEAIEMDDLTVLGPINVLKLKFSPKGYDRRLVAELWLYPDNTRILELSTKCTPGEAFQVAAETRAFLTDRGVTLTGEQQTKTRTALEFFAKQPH